MTDQRPIDVSTLRDGDVVRAKRGERGVVEGVLRWAGDEWQIRSGASVRTVIACSSEALDGGWTITDILRPVLVKGDRVEWVGASRKRKASTATVCQVNGDYVAVIRDDDVADKWPIEAVRRLPTAPEPAPIEVGDWWADEDGLPHVVEVLHDGSVGLRRWTDSVVNRFVEPSLLRDYWTRLDGPPEPPEGSVYVIAGDVWHRKTDGLHLQATSYQAWPHSWIKPKASFDVVRRYSPSDLATLQIVHTLGVE